MTAQPGSSTDTYLLTAKPGYAVTAWLDDRNVYIELPSKGQMPPYVLSFDLSEGGLSKALHLMRQGYLAARQPKPEFRKTRGPRERYSPYNDDQRAAAAAALKKVGIG